jgi:uncharacterized hydrophobic protein (TIGR00271 family)
MLALRVYAPAAAVHDVMALLARHQGVEHVFQVGDGAVADLTLVTADIDSGTMDDLLPRIVECGVPGNEIEIVHISSTRPLGKARSGDLPSWSGGGLALTELTTTSRHYARAVPQYLVFMACAGVIAVFGVLTSNPILIVGAMAISPDLLPMCATCVAIVNKRPRLGLRALVVLVVGLGVAGAFAFMSTVLLRLGDYPPATDALGDGGLGVLPTVNASTVGVAFFAGIAGMLAFETRSSSAVGVAISITTIPAAAFAGAAIAFRDRDGAAHALAVLGVNITMLVLAGTLTLLLQRRYRRSR